MDANVCMSLLLPHVGVTIDVAAQRLALQGNKLRGAEQTLTCWSLLTRQTTTIHGQHTKMLSLVHLDRNHKKTTTLLLQRMRKKTTKSNNNHLLKVLLMLRVF